MPKPSLEVLYEDNHLLVVNKPAAMTVHPAPGHPGGTLVDARIINTTSPAGLYTSMGQSNYGPAKAGIANMTIVTAAELGRYGVTVNAISPGARTPLPAVITVDPK